MTILVLAVFGGLAGAALFGGGVGGFWTGAAFGALVGWIVRLGKRVEVLEEHLVRAVRDAAQRSDDPRGAAAAPQRHGEPLAAAPAQPRQAAADARAAELPLDLSLDSEPPAAPSAVAAAAAPSSRAARASSASSADDGTVPPRRPTHEQRAAHRARAGRASNHDHGWIDVAIEYVQRWFTTGNVPVKVGVVLFLFGVGFLVKEGIDRNLLPLELRLALVAAFGLALLVIGWRLRSSKRTYALSVQGGGIAVLYLTTFAAFALYGLLPGTVAFAFLLIVTAAAGALAVLQDSRALAVLGIVGGFMAPVLTSSDSGNHVALFGYYAVLNLAVLGIAWFKAWRELNVLGFAFTFFIGGLWGYGAYTPERFATTEPFLIFFVMLYTLVPVLFATRVAPVLRGFVDGTLTFGTPIVGFALQSQLVGDSRFGLALSAAALALWYVGLATYLYRRREPALAVLVEALLALSIAFVTVAVPLALDARWTSAAWALQGAAMVWLGFRQQRMLALAAGCALQLLAGASYVLQPFSGAVLPVANGYFIGAVLIAAAGWLTSRWFDRAREAGGGGIALLGAVAAFVWASGWWLTAGFAEIDRAVPAPYELASALGFIAATVLLAMIVSRAARWPAFDHLALVLWPAAAVAASAAPFEQAHPFAYGGWLAWPVLCAVAYAFLRLREHEFPQLQNALHALMYWVVAFLLGSETLWAVDRIAGGVWPLAAALTVLAAFVLATLALRHAPRWPFGAHAEGYVRLCAGAVTSVLAVLALAANAWSPGDAAPLPYVPLLNPLEIASVIVLVAAVRVLQALGEQHHVRLTPRSVGAAAALLALFFLTMAVARAVHHYTGVPFDADSLAASSVMQAALSIVWGIAGLTAMVLGARRKHRVVWIGGAALMAVVVVKLFLVELDNTDTLGRVISFLGVGVLLLVVGYFAPVPPRAELDERAA